MTLRSRNLAVAFFAAALMTMALSFALTTERAHALLAQPPSEVTILHLEWDRAESSPGVISEGVKSVFPASTFTEVSDKASDFFEQASYRVFPGWTTKFAGTFKIAAPRLPSGEGGHSQPCDTRFFEDVTSRADAAAQAAGVSLGSSILYYYDEKLCAQMPDAGSEAAVSIVGGTRRAVMQVTRESGPTRHELVHAVGHFMRLQHADSLLCNAGGVRVPFSDGCTVEPAGDPYDSMGEGTGTFSAGAIKALGWLKDDQHREVVAPNDDLRRTFALGTITDGGSATPLPTRAIRFSDGGTNFWLEFRAHTGIDATEPPFPSQGTTGVILHKEIKPTFGREPSFQLVDLSPSTPRSDAGLRLPAQSWENPLGRMKITFVNFATGGATVTIGPKPGTPPLPPTSPTALVVQLGWDGQAAGTGATEDLRPQLELTTASNQASTWFEAVSGGIQKWKTHYAALTIPTPRSEFRGAELPSRCSGQTFADIDASAEAGLRERGFALEAYARIFYIYNGAVCLSMPDSRGTAFPSPKRTVVQATGANFGTPLARSQTLIEAVGHELGLAHSPALDCVSDDDFQIPTPFSHTCTQSADPYGIMGGGVGSFSAPELDQLGWMKAPGGFDEVERSNLLRRAIVPLEAAAGASASQHRAVFLPDAEGGFWIEYRRPDGVDAPGVSGSTENVLGLLIHREDRRTTPDGVVRSFHLIDVTPDTPKFDAVLAVGNRVRVAEYRITLLSADQDRAELTTEFFEEDVEFPVPLPHPVPPANPDPKHSMLVLNVGWDDPNPEASVPLDPALADKAAYIVNVPVNQWYRQSIPAGLYTDWRAYSGGSLKIASPVRGEARCEDDEIWGRAERAARAAGIEPDRFGHVMVTLARSPCGYGGLAPLPGRQTIIAGSSSSTIKHELGHSLGNFHSEALRCFRGPRDGVKERVPLSNDCEVETYGDFADAMGLGPGAYGPLYAFHRGWLEDQYVSVGAGIVERTVHLRPYTGEQPPIEGQPRALRLIDGLVTLWMEWRQPVGPDEKVTPGLYIRREAIHPIFGDPTARLLDMTPSPEARDPGLPVGQTWANPLGTMEITLESGDASGATVTIRRQGA